MMRTNLRKLVNLWIDLLLLQTKGTGLIFTQGTRHSSAGEMVVLTIWNFHVG